MSKRMPLMFDRVSAIARGERKQGREKENWDECFALLPIYRFIALLELVGSPRVVLTK